LDVYILWASVALGPATGPTSKPLQPKDELIRLARIANSQFATYDAKDHISRNVKFTAAYGIVQYPASFEAVDLHLPDFSKSVSLTDDEPLSIAEHAARELAAPIIAAMAKPDTGVAAPHQLRSPEKDSAHRLSSYEHMLRRMTWKGE
jgi:hypothetical protein